MVRLKGSGLGILRGLTSERTKIISYMSCRLELDPNHVYNNELTHASASKT